MKSGLRVIAVIPARGGSKSIPRKNIKPLAGKPLILWSIEAAKNTPEIDRVIVSTDDPSIADIARKGGAEVYTRPAHLATDEALVIDALRDLISTLEAEGEKHAMMVLLEPTCPLRTVEDISACLNVLAGGYESVATFKEADLNPHRAWTLTDNGPEVFVPGAIPWLPRQKLPRVHQLNGAVYAFKTASLGSEGRAMLFGKCGAVLMPKERSVDIDEEIDFEFIETLIRNKKHV
jgi:CMP-N,N'-diacetyllegionaminic acid synthase